MLLYLEVFQEFVENKHRVYRTSTGFGVELGREEGLALVADAFVRAIIQIDV